MDKNQDIFPDDESLEKEFPLLHSFSKENPFSVPEGYFDDLPSTIIEKCRTETKSWKSGVGLFSLFSRLKWNLGISISAIVSVCVICFFVIHANIKPVSYEVMLQNTPDSLIVAQLDKNITDLNESTLEELQPGDQAMLKDMDQGIGSDTTNSNNQEIISYLMEHHVNVSDIENE